MPVTNTLDQDAGAAELGAEAAPTWCASSPNAENCRRLIRALAVETHENWLEATRYLNMAHLAEPEKEEMRRIEQVEAA